jgi:peptidyl-tRNA hydrolase
MSAEREDDAAGESPVAGNDGQRRLLDGRHAFQQAIREGIAAAAAEGCREMWFCDAHYGDWPLSERAVIETLSAWAYSHRKLVVLAHTFEQFPKRHARWVEWRRQWSHIVECRALEEIESAEVPCLLLAPDVVTVRIHDAVRHRGTWSRALDDAIRARELVDAVSQRSVESFPATTLGL